MPSNTSLFFDPIVITMITMTMPPSIVSTVLGVNLLKD